MKQLGYLLNLPWTILGVVNAIFSIPYKIEIRNQAVIFHCFSCGLIHLYAPHAKGFAFGNIVVVRKGTKPNILEHELVHVEQYMRYPFIYQFLYWIELLRKGYWNNRFEVEAYDRTNTWPEEKRWF